nr:unnamed protein product [Spirometra erinaceieuropaei]
MSGLPQRRLSQRSRRPAITRALDYLSGEGLSSPEPLEPSGDGDNSFDTLPPADDTITEVRREPSLSDRMADLEHTIEVMCQHLARMSRNQELILEGIRRLVGGQRDLESAVSRRPTTNTTVASRLPINPIGSPLRTVADFRALNAKLADSEVRSQLVAYLACLGGRSLDDFTKRVYYALFVDDISLHINFKGRKMKEGLSDSPTYGVIKEVFGIWNGDGKATLADLEVSVTKRLKRSLDSLSKKMQKNINDTQASDPKPGTSTGSCTSSLTDSPNKEQ